MPKCPLCNQEMKWNTTIDGDYYEFYTCYPCGRMFDEGTGTGFMLEIPNRQYWDDELRPPDVDFDND